MAAQTLINQFLDLVVTSEQLDEICRQKFTIFPFLIRVRKNDYTKYCTVYMTLTVYMHG